MIKYPKLSLIAFVLPGLDQVFYIDFQNFMR